MLLLKPQKNNQLAMAEYWTTEDFRTFRKQLQIAPIIMKWINPNLKESSSSVFKIAPPKPNYVVDVPKKERPSSLSWSRMRWGLDTTMILKGSINITIAMHV